MPFFEPRVLGVAAVRAIKTLVGATSTLSFFAAPPPPQVNSKAPVIIPPDKMEDLKDAPPDARYEMMFARRAGLPVPFMPIRHSAVAFKNPTSDKYYVYGRQSPWNFFNWWRDGITFHTQMDNEKNYLHPNYPFTAHPTGVSFTKEEIQALLTGADKEVNQRQTCNMINSNCYSASTSVLCSSVNTLLQRESFNAKDVSKVLTVLESHPMQDHFSIGVKNNEVVVSNLKEMLNAVKERVESIDKPTKLEHELHNKVIALLDTLADCSKEDHLQNPFVV